MENVPSEVNQLLYGDDEPEHSPMGGSKAACFIACPGSVSLGQGLSDPESDYAAEGTLAHAVAADCLNSGQDAWELLDEKKGITKEMTDAVQVYLDDVRRFSEGEEMGWVEEGFQLPEVHKHFRGFLDKASLFRLKDSAALRLWDYKHGVGIVVEVEDNSQLKYYGVGLILKIKKELNIEIEKVFFKIVQPRSFHSDGPVREVVYTRDELFEWAETVLVPAMVRAETDTTTVAGEHCRFCPVRFHDCPALDKYKEEAGRLMHFHDEGVIGKIGSLSNERVGHFLDLFDKMKIVGKAMGVLAYQRSMAGQRVPGRKLVYGGSNRIWKDEAKKAAEEKFKLQAFEDRKLKSPAQMETLPEGKEFAAQYAFKPPSKLQLVPESDKKTAVNRNTKSLFTPVKEKVG